MEADEAADRPPAGESGHDVIRVVNAARGLVPASTLSEDELRTLLLDMLDAGGEKPVLGPEDGRASTRQTLLSLPSLNARHRQAAQEVPLPEAVEFIQLRQLLYDRGVVPLGRNRQEANEFSEDDARPPHSKELWVGAAGHGLASWARAAAPDDHIELEAAVVLLAHLGRPATLGTGTGLSLPLEQRQARAALAGGRWGSGTFWELGALRDPRDEGSEAGRALAWLARQAADSLLGGFPASVREFPEAVLETRLSPSSYGFAAGGWQGAARVERGDVPALGRALLAWHGVAESAAGLSLVAAALGADSAPPADNSEPPLGALLQVEEGAPYGPAAGPSATVTYGAAPLGRAALESYKDALGRLAREVAAAVGAGAARWPALPLNAAVFIFSQGGAGALARVLAAGAEDAAAPYLAGLRDRVRGRRAAAAAERREQASVIRARQYLIIAERKLGSGRYDAVMQTILADPVSYDIDSPADILQAVRVSGGKTGAKDAALVEREYANREAEMAARAANDCPHVGLVRRLRAATSADEEGRLYKKLREFFPPAARRAQGGQSGQSSWVLCASCDFRLLCPHVETLVRLRQRHAPYEEVRRALLPYANTADYASESGAHGFATYCRVCSEELFRRVQADDEAGAETLGRVGSFDDELRKFIWVEAVKIADRGGLLRFAQPVDPRRFATEVAATCHPLAVVMAGRKRPGRLRAAGGDELARRYQEFVALVYLYAYLFALLLSAPGRRKPLTHLDVPGGLGGGAVGLELEGVRVDAAADALAQRLLADLVTRHSLLLSQLTGVTNEQVGALFQLAYRHLLDSHGQLLLVAEDGAKVFSTVVTRLSPYYAALQTGLRVVGTMPALELPAEARPGPGRPLGGKEGRRAARQLALPATPEGVAKEFQTIMGGTLDSFISEKFDAKYGPFIRAALAGRGAVQYPDGVSPDWVYAIPALGLYKKAWGTRDGTGRKYWRRLAEKRGGRAAPAKGRAAPADGPGAGAGAAGTYLDGLYLLVYYMTGVHDDEEWGQYQAALALARAREAPCNDARLLGGLPAFDPALVQGPSPYYAHPPAALTQLYDEEGRRHVWDVYLWAGAGAEDLTFDRAQLRQLVGEGADPLAGREFTDWVCSVCGVRWSQTGGLDAEKAAASVRRIETQGAFFSYFETRCPEGGVHTFGEAAVCAKCGVSTALLGAGAERGGEAGAAYFTKYEATFREQTAMPESALAGIIADAGPAPGPQPAPLALSDVTRDFGPVLALAKFMQERGAETTTAEIEAMGATEGRTLAQVRAGEEAPPPPTRLTDPRIAAAEGNLRVLLTRYSTLWNSRGRPEAQLLDAHGWLGPLLSKLPDLPASVEALPAPAAAGLAGKYFSRLSQVRQSARDALAAQHAKDRQDIEALAAVRAGWAAALHQYAIDSFCAAAMAIAKSGAAGEVFVGSVVADILLSESRFTAAGEFQWSVFGDAEEISRSAEDSSGDDVRMYGGPGAGAEGADAAAARDRANDDGYGDGVVFSNEDLDMDASTVAANLEG